MKLIYLFTFFLALFTNILPSSAQNAVSIRVGLNKNSWRTSVEGVKIYPDDGSSQPYPIISVPLEYDLSKNWTIQVDPSLIWKGATIDYIKKGQTYKACRLSVWYIELPILAKLYLDKPKTGFHLLLGPSVGYALSGKVKKGNNFLYQGTRLNETLSFEVAKYPNSEISLNAGLGIRFGKSGLDLRFAWGLTNLGIKGDGYAKYYNQGIHLAYLYNFWNNRNLE